MSTKTSTQVKCYHCDEKTYAPIFANDLPFCCNGCKTVYEILSNNGLCNYYEFSDKPGVRPDEVDQSPFKHLDSPAAFDKLGLFEDEDRKIVKLSLPYMHCSSCVWLLEKLHKIDPFITHSKVDFFRKEIKITYLKNEIQLSAIIALLHKLGYAPDLSLSNSEKKKHHKKNRVLKLGIAGFCFGNIMLLNFPEYVDDGFKLVSPEIAKWFSIIAILLSLPALVYSASEFFVSAWKSIRSKTLNIDLPIAVAVLATFIRSLYDIALGIGPGFLDTMCGIIFLMLAGRWFQDFTYKHIYFERNFKNYFPLFVTRLKNQNKESVQVEQLLSGDSIELKHGEILPADSILKSNKAHFDLSFITGESKIISKSQDQYIYAGSKVKGNKSEFLIVKPVSRSYLTGIWENQKDQESLLKENNYTEKISKYFALIVLVIAIAGFAAWSFTGFHEAFNVFTAILIIACPCTILLATSFTYGHAIRYLGRIGLFLKQNDVINKLGQINHITFDKTGTLTNRLNENALYSIPSQKSHIQLASSLAQHSSHPVSAAIHKSYEGNFDVKGFEQIDGSGIQGFIDEKFIQVGKASFTKHPISMQHEDAGAYLSIDHQPMGYFTFEQQLRAGATNMLQKLKKDLKLSLFSGDNDRTRGMFANTISSLHFFLKPDEKLKEVEKLQANGDNVLMIGDGLNDAPALLAADCGLAVAETENCFFPSCDGLLKANKIHLLPNMLIFVKKVNQVILISFLASVLYNIVGIGFALSNMLSPLVAAILMPTCSVTIIVVTWALVHRLYLKYLKNN
jgi:Cu+-exporting ATPase